MPEPSRLITKNKVSFTHLESLKTQLSKLFDRKKKGESK